MNIYYIERIGKRSYAEYDSAVVIAESEEAAKRIRPDGSDIGAGNPENDWVDSVDMVRCELVGTAKDGSCPGVLCDSYHEGW
jgi:hypothetical protein